MPQSSPSYTTTWIDSVSKVAPEVWNALAKPLKTPFFEWEWLTNLESSGSASAQQGWLPHHLLVWAGNDLAAIAPLYLKGHSYGEFVFDHQWADLAHRLGIEYYPKLLGMAPFTPAEGYRFLMLPDRPDEDKLIDLIVSEIDRFCDRQNISSCHFLYIDPEWKSKLESRGYTAWLHHSYIWENQRFSNFDDYLKNFNANQRRNIKRERKAVNNAGLTMRVYTGDGIPHHLFSFMYDLYSDTCDKFGWWGSKYLNRKFFEQLEHSFRDRVVFVAAEAEGISKPVGMSFCIRKGDRLYGRYWGCMQEIECLHFDACYYTPIDWAIAEGIQVFDPGAGGRHKKRRGFPALPNYSLHRFYRPRLRQILLPHIHEVNEYERQQIEAINQDLPFDFNPPALDSCG
ncbi:GNAT family N-acetyltransferase [Pseudanabaena sp. PCC 6802]|uniref:GNAT family N-acetyltransferase n=1 Tax=Pseudanabaena sp. PCC 6802 TaxID=118173 RepID=UPI000346EFAA|nr:GNAT family N-acetyltransferase [Pseudanabaena sp. PCC 6802]